MWSSISIDHDRRNNIHRYVPALEHKQSLGIIPRIFELADEREEGHVTSVRENDVGDAQESVREGYHSRGLYDWIWSFDADGDHSDQNGAEDGDECCGNTQSTMTNHVLGATHTRWKSTRLSSESAVV